MILRFARRNRQPLGDGTLPEAEMADLQVLGIVPLPDTRAYYRPVLDLAGLILQRRNIALELGGADVQLGSLLINTNDLFEKFVRVSLTRHAREESWPAEVLDGNAEGKKDLYDVPAELPAPLGEPMDALAAATQARRSQILCSAPSTAITY